MIVASAHRPLLRGAAELLLLAPGYLPGVSTVILVAVWGAAILELVAERRR